MSKLTLCDRGTKFLHWMFSKERFSMFDALVIAAYLGLGTSYGWIGFILFVIFLIPVSFFAEFTVETYL